mmetsp:Transcript_70724/g.218724  ORF Transcript_70724/g.218724 Transcript_70724/m.218724 type:complete len:480 (+) Transcript_70724:93-1532(+)|eukprot:CAMPEP_0204592868 /NCGR_PEP_ID=MMETSP0661-20131031/51178_1 /ASSEMBLY_ACC=CAM_ASM_000606 /TAXON_ID=109239 /ORGANISM="Alexandrium margalefi, Strain AMGDE01CS-322" /LENGTH=479 /DNA_ID=CAMNT_0051603117 /DNA_START=73 /DNA_END=1512 /DNA_ORIENTATION=-
MSVMPVRSRGRRQPAARDLIVLLVFGCRFVQTLLRMAMGALVVYICEEYACAASAKGWILSAHAFGYCTTQVIGGVWADRAGGRGVAAVALALAGAALAVTPLAAAAMGLWGIAATQVVMGAAMGPLFPATMQVLAKWLPPSERAFASTALDSGITVGSLVAVPFSGFLAVRSSWRLALVLYGLAAMGYSAVWARCAAERPEECSYCDKEEQALLSETLPAPRRAAETSADARDLLLGVRHMRFWAIYLAHFAFNYSVYFVNSWSATYYLETFGLRPESAGLHLSLPHAVNMVVKVAVSPALAQSLKAAGLTDLGCRRSFSGLGFLAPALCLQLLPLAVGSACATTALFSAALGFMALHPSGFKANYMDVTRSHGGTVSGIGNTIASVASSIGPLMVSQVRAASGGWSQVFHSVALVNLLAAGIFCTLSSATPIEAGSAPGPCRERSDETQVERILGLAGGRVRDAGAAIMPRRTAARC